MTRGGKRSRYKNLTLQGVFVRGSEIELPDIKARWRIIQVFWTRHTIYESGQIISETHVKLKKQ